MIYDISFHIRFLSFFHQNWIELNMFSANFFLVRILVQILKSDYGYLHNTRIRVLWRQVNR